MTDSSDESVIFVAEESGESDAVVADDPSDCVVMFVRRHQSTAKKMLPKIRPSKRTRLKERTSDDAAVGSKETPLVHSDLYSSLSPHSQPGTDGQNCTTLNVPPTRDCNDQLVPCVKKRKKLSLRKRSCLNPPLANEPRNMSCVLDESLPDLCILEPDTEDSCVSTVTKNLVGDTHCSEKTKDLAEAGCRTLNNTQIVDDMDGQMSTSFCDISTPNVSLLSSSVSHSDDNAEVPETLDILLLPNSTTTSGSNDTTVSGSPDVVELSPTLNSDPERSNSVNATEAQHTDEELLSDVIDITECTCDEHPWLCDKCVAELNTWKTTAPHEEPTVEQELSVGTLLPPPAVEQEHLCDETSKTSSAHIENAETETINKCSASADQLEDAKTETVNSCSVATTDPTVQCLPTHLDTPVCSRDDVCQSICSNNCLDKSGSESAVLSKKLILQTQSTEEKCSCKETKGLCPQCTANLDNSWSEANSKGCAEITKPTTQGLGSEHETTSSVVQEGKCTRGVVTSIFSVCIEKLDSWMREDGRKYSTNVAAEDTFTHASPWVPAVILSDQKSTCNETSGICPLCVSTVNNSKIATASTTVIKDPPSQQATTLVRRLKRRFVIESGSATEPGNVSLPPKKRRVGSTCGQPVSIAVTVSRRPRCKRQYRCLACGIMVTTAKLFQCANGHCYCRNCVKDLAKHTVDLNECFYPRCKSLIHINTDASHKPPSNTVSEAGDKLDQEHTENVTKRTSRDLSTQRNDNDSHDKPPVSSITTVNTSKTAIAPTTVIKDPSSSITQVKNSTTTAPTTVINDPSSNITQVKNSAPTTVTNDPSSSITQVKNSTTTAPTTVINDPSSNITQVKNSAPTTVVNYPSSSITQVKNSTTATAPATVINDSSSSITQVKNSAPTTVVNDSSSSITQVKNSTTATAPATVINDPSSNITQVKNSAPTTVTNDPSSSITQVKNSTTATAPTTVINDPSSSITQVKNSAPTTVINDSSSSIIQVKNSAPTTVINDPSASQLVTSVVRGLKRPYVIDSGSARVVENISVPPKNQHISVTSRQLLSEVQEDTCSCGVVSGPCSVCVAKLDSLNRKDVTKHSTSVTDKYIFKHLSPWLPNHVLSSKSINSKNDTASATITKDPSATQQPGALVSVLKRPRDIVTENSSASLIKPTLVPSKTQNVTSTSCQPASSVPVITSTESGSGRKYKCLACGIMVTPAKLFQCANGHCYCRHCVKDLARHTVNPNECLYPQCKCLVHINTHVSHKPPTPRAVGNVGDKPSEEHVQNATRQMLRDLSTHVNVNDSDSDSGDDLPVVNFNLSQTVDALTLPADWEPMDINGDMKVVTVSPGSVPFQTVALMFQASMPPTVAEIVSIRRVQNPILWQFYSVRRKQMLQRNGAGELNEMKLFHGTGSAYVEAISRSNFDWRLCGKHGTAFGQGSYFAAHANYSHSFTDRNNHVVAPLANVPSPGNVHPASLAAKVAGILPWMASFVAPPVPPAAKRRGRQKAPRKPRKAPKGQAISAVPVLTKHTMFVARVLVGRYTAGKPNLRKPPPLTPSDPYGRCFDSCVDRCPTPTVFVIFESSQCYPEYIIEYTSTMR